MRLQELIWTGAAVAALAAARGAAADTNASGAAPLSEVVVTATRTATTVDELAIPVIVITRDEIEHALATDLASLLIGHGGIEIARNGGPGQPAAVFLRGTESDHTTVLIDGVRINPGTIGGAPLQNIQPESIERVEIVKGARSSLYGTDAIGGVINIITRAGASPGASLYASSGRYDTQVVAADASGMLSERFGAGASYAYQRSDGFPPVEGSNVPGDYNNQSANAQLRYVASDALTWRAQAWRASGKSAYSEFGSPSQEDFLDDSYAVGADWKGDAGSTRASSRRAAPPSRSNQRQTPDFDRTTRDALDAQYSWRADAAQEWTIGHGGGERAHAVLYPSGFRTTCTPTPRWPSRRTSSTRAQTTCCSRSATTIMKRSARTRPGTSSTATTSIRPGARHSRSARPFMRPTAPTCTVSAAIRRSTPRSRARANSECNGTRPESNICDCRSFKTTSTI